MVDVVEVFVLVFFNFWSFNEYVVVDFYVYFVCKGIFVVDCFNGGCFLRFGFEEGKFFGYCFNRIEVCYFVYEEFFSVFESVV